MEKLPNEFEKAIEILRQVYIRSLKSTIEAFRVMGLPGIAITKKQARKIKRFVKRQIK